VDFTKAEAIFYASLFAAGSFCSLVRTYRDNDRTSWHSIVGRCLASGIYGFGVIAIWFGSHPPNSNTSGFYFLAIAGFIGYLDKEIQVKLSAWIIDWVFRKTGGQSDGK
jgi:hypothetical protein